MDFKLHAQAKPTQLAFIFGSPLAHSLSPVMHNAAFQYLGLPWAYVPLELKSSALGAAVDLLRSANVRGANVTVPYKQEIIPYLDSVEKEARQIGSVNTLYVKNGKIHGTSTDGEGFLRSLGEQRKKLPGSKGVIVGAGGAARSIGATLASSGAKEIYIANRTIKRAEGLAKNLKGIYRRLSVHFISLKEAELLLRSMDWVVQTTSLGLSKNDPAPLSLGNASPHVWVLDLIYHRPTMFLNDAKKRGLRSFNGLGMLLNQGALSFQIWTGRKPPLLVMQRALTRELDFRSH